MKFDFLSVLPVYQHIDCTWYLQSRHFTLTSNWLLCIYFPYTCYKTDTITMLPWSTNYGEFN